MTTVDDPRWEATDFLDKVTSVVPSIIYVFNQQTQSNEYANRNLAETLGYSGADIQEMGDEFMPRLCHPDDLAAMGAYFQELRSLLDGETMQFEYRMRHRDGHYVWLLSVDTVFDRDDKGNVFRHIGTATDITPMKENEEAVRNSVAELERRANELQQSNDNLSVVTYAATHDLKVPINNITGLIEALEEDGHLDAPEAAEVVAMIRRSCEQAQDKIAAIVEVTDVRAGLLSAEPVVLDDAVEAILNDVTTINHRDSLSVDIAACPVVHFPRFHLESILSNLVSNAIKFSHPDRTPEITIRSWSDADRARLSVDDNGLGLNVPADLPKVFGLFKRAHPGIDGTGIGLYTVRQVLRRAGGDIDVTSIVGEGSTFSVDFGPGSAP
jgi:PAS domain S-box-containing protein